MGSSSGSDVVPRLWCPRHRVEVDSVCEACEVRRIADRVLDKSRPDVPIPGHHKRLLAPYALEAIAAREEAQGLSG